MKKVLIVAALVAALVAAGAAGAAPGPRYKWNPSFRKDTYNTILRLGYPVRVADCLDKYVPYYMNELRQAEFGLNLDWVKRGGKGMFMKPHSQMKSDLVALAQQCHTFWPWDENDGD